MNSAGSGFNSIGQFTSVSGGVLLVDKEANWTSFDVVKKVRGMLGVKRVGHAGTLDPLATGLLVLCSNQMTKFIDHYQADEKEYQGVFTLGAVTESFDAATMPTDFKPTDGISLDALRLAANAFLGTQQQLPPMYSAAKVNGTRLYVLARQGKVVERKTKTITISSFSIDHFDMPDVFFTVVCSRGTYIRTLVHDLGQRIECGAYLKTLRRLRIGEFHISNAWTIQSLSQAVKI